MDNDIYKFLVAKLDCFTTKEFYVLGLFTELWDIWQVGSGYLMFWVVFLWKICLESNFMRYLDIPSNRYHDNKSANSEVSKLIF